MATTAHSSAPLCPSGSQPASSTQSCQTRLTAASAPATTATAVSRRRRVRGLTGERVWARRAGHARRLPPNGEPRRVGAPAHPVEERALEPDIHYGDALLAELRAAVEAVAAD